MPAGIVPPTSSHASSPSASVGGTPRSRMPRTSPRTIRSQSRQQPRGVDDAGPAPFVPGVSPAEVAWAPDEASREFLGNADLLSLW